MPALTDEYVHDDLDLVKAIRVTEVLPRVGGQGSFDAERADGAVLLVDGGDPDSAPRGVKLHQL